jgi:hypothetical protein
LLPQKFSGPGSVDEPEAAFAERRETEIIGASERLDERER